MRKFLIFLVLLFSASVCFAEKGVIRPKGSPTAAPYRPGILADGTLYVAGQLGRDAAGKVPEHFEAEVKQVLENAGVVLKEAGIGFEDS